MLQADIRRRLDELRGDLRSPGVLVSWEIETGPDVAGDPAVWVWLIIRDPRVERVGDASFGDDMLERVRRTVHDVVGEDVQLYVRFRIQSENQELHGKGRANGVWPGVAGSGGGVRSRRLRGVSTAGRHRVKIPVAA